MSPIPIPDQPRVSLLTSKEWARRWRARGDSRVELAFDIATSPDGEGAARAIVEDYAWGSVTWEVNGMRTDTRPGRYVTAAPGVPVEVAHARARDLVAPQVRSVGTLALPAPVPATAFTATGGSGLISTLALTQVTWGPVEVALVGLVALAGGVSVTARTLRRSRHTRIRPVEAIGYESVVYDFLGIGARVTIDPHLDAMLTETLREVIDDVEHVTDDVTSTRLATMRAALPAPVVPERVLERQDRTRSAATVAVEQAETRRAYVDARVDAVAELVTRNA